MPLPHENPPISRSGFPIYYQGPPLDQGALPSVLFFALSAQMSLFEDPFNQPVLRLVEQGVRVFSWDLPFHEPLSNPHEAMHKWAHAFIHQPSFITEFLDLCQDHLNYLIQENFIDPKRLGIAGLSRGGFIATHLAARDSRFKTVLGFSPLTQPQPLEELKSFPTVSFDEISLISLADRLVDKHVRFYIGNHDTRVGTDACYGFIRHLTETAFNKGIRSPAVELVIYPSIGHKGHGTPTSIFFDGADWMSACLKNDRALA